jgi:hypothetical protein
MSEHPIVVDLAPTKGALYLRTDCTPWRRYEFDGEVWRDLGNWPPLVLEAVHLEWHENIVRWTASHAGYKATLWSDGTWRVEGPWRDAGSGHRLVADGHNSIEKAKELCALTIAAELKRDMIEGISHASTEK